MLCRDVSNFTVPLTPAILQQWRAEGVGLLIIQCFPPTYRQYAEQRDQMRLCAQEGMPFDGYIYDYLGAPDWLDGALEGLAIARMQDGVQPRFMWLDEEDTETEAGWTWQQRTNAVMYSVGRVKQHFDVSPGIYTGAWWWQPRMGPANLSEQKLWVAQYDGIPDAEVFSPFGHWSECRVKQYAGSQPDGTDLNVLSDAEAAELEEPDMDCGPFKSAIEVAVNRLQIELAKKTAAGKPAALSKPIVREISSELFQALQG